VKAGDPIFVDTWAWLALGHRRDPNHIGVREIFEGCRSLPLAIHTSDYVLDELITLLFRRENYIEATQFLNALLADQMAGSLQIQRVTAERFLAALELRKRLKDKPLISFTDLSSMAIMKELGITAVLTEDEHFLHVGMGFEKIP
jgi:predicted nucleic acid-binding protein